MVSDKDKRLHSTPFSGDPKAYLKSEVPAWVLEVSMSLGATTSHTVEYWMNHIATQVDRYGKDQWGKGYLASQKFIAEKSK